MTAAHNIPRKTRIQDYVVRFTDDPVDQRITFKGRNDDHDLLVLWVHFPGANLNQNGRETLRFSSLPLEKQEDVVDVGFFPLDLRNENQTLITLPSIYTWRIT